MARYRLRFLLQEFDLARGATLIGRSADCHVTIEDPLVSRQHARIVIEGDEATFEDLGSRNGVKVNGQAIKEPTKLKDGDRLRIGTQELVFCHVGPAAAMSAKTTGFLRYCAQCRLPYPQELVACPACGATEQTDEDTLSGQFGASSKHSWSVQLLVEVTEKALSLARIGDALRMLQRAKAQIEERMATGGPVEADQLAQLSSTAIKVSIAAEDPVWACWVTHLYGQLGQIPPIKIIEEMSEIVQTQPYRNALEQPIIELAAKCRTIPAPKGPQLEALSRLDELQAAILAGEVNADVTATNPAIG
ncbi:MAG: FHA domain-containing protein [Polyangiaceae bacterium]